MTSRAFRSISLTLVATSLLLCPAVARAQSDDERARLHFQAGRSYFEQGRYEDSLREWQESYRLSNRQILLVNIANAQERLLQFDDAIQSLQRYLEIGGAEATENRATIESRIESMRAMSRRVQGSATPPTQPTPPTTETTTVTQTPPTETATVETPTEQPPTEQPPAEQPQPRRRLLWTWVALAATGAFGAVAIGTGAVALGHASDLEEQCPDHQCPNTSTLQDTRDSGYSLALTTDIFIGLTAAAAIGMVVAVILELRARRASSTSLLPAVGPGQASLLLRF
jgi:tetratricopeptide (TPR) repeat protein